MACQTAEHAVAGDLIPNPRPTSQEKHCRMVKIDRHLAAGEQAGHASPGSLLRQPIEQGGCVLLHAEDLTVCAFCQVPPACSGPSETAKLSPSMLLHMVHHSRLVPHFQDAAPGARTVPCCRSCQAGPPEPEAAFAQAGMAVSQACAQNQSRKQQWGST